MKPSILLLVGIISLVVGSAAVERQPNNPSRADKLFARAKADDFLGDSSCASCHAEKASHFEGSPHASFMTNPQSPNDKKGCEGCHGPYGIHQAEENPEVIAFRKWPAKDSSAACLRCHQSSLSESHWKSTAHAKAGVSCVSCHQIHPDSEPNWADGNVKKTQIANTRAAVFVAKFQPKGLLMAEEPKVCGQCHAPQMAEFKLNSHHPVTEGEMVCSDCHTVHPTKTEKLRKHFSDEKCLTCHTEFAGPFVYEHDPVAGHTGEGCIECHRAHGSHMPKMLKGTSRGLCAQCHTDKLSEHFPGQSCWNAGCHVAVHGSNSSRRLLTP